jgi:hypothetical protein
MCKQRFGVQLFRIHCYKAAPQEEGLFTRPAMCYFIDEGRLYTFTVYQQPELLIEATAKAAGTSVRARQTVQFLPARWTLLCS